MTPEDESTPADAAGTPIEQATDDRAPDDQITDEQTTDETIPEDASAVDATAEDLSTEDLSTEDPSTDAAPEDDEGSEGVEAEGTLLERSQAAIDDAHEAVQRVAATDAIGEDATGARDLPPFADSTEGVEKPDPDEADDA
jgi:hypothetical protein